jgi:phosphoribosylamine--glycine ligase
MRVLIVDKSGDGLLDLALRAWNAGHDVRYFLAAYDAQKRPVGKGLIERVADWRGSMGWADLVLMAGLSYARDLEPWRRAGVPIVGATPDAAAWESDRLAGMAVLQRAGIDVPPYRQCRTIDEAIATVAKRGEGMAVKPCGDVADKSLSFVAKSPEEMLWRLGRWKREGKRFPCGLLLQDRIDGVEMAVGAWFGPDGFAPGWEENFEEKRLFAGALGPNCGEAGTVMRLVERSKLAHQVLQPLEDELDRVGYIGNVDVNCIIDGQGRPWPLEFTMRFGYPAINIELQLHQGDPIEFLYGVATGKVPRARRFDEIAVGVVCALPPYPFGHERTEEVVGVPIWGVTPAIADRIHFCDAQRGVDSDFATAGSYVLVAAATAATVSAARRQALQTLDRLRIPASPFWRIDIGRRLRSQLSELQRHGFARDLVYA